MKIEDWKKVSEHGNPEDGLYIALWKCDGALVVDLIDYNAVEDQWLAYDSDDYATIEREVVAYFPQNFDVVSLINVRAALEYYP